MLKPIALGSERRHYFDDVGRDRLLGNDALYQERRVDCKGRKADQRRIEFFGEDCSKAGREYEATPCLADKPDRHGEKLPIADERLLRHAGIGHAQYCECQHRDVGQFLKPEAPICLRCKRS